MAAGNYLEIPTALFFVDGAKGSSGMLMPLAIQFSVYNKNTYSPQDAPADWMLAKAEFNALDNSVHAVIHFLNGMSAD